MSTHHRATRAKRIKRVAGVGLFLIAVAVTVVGVDWGINTLRPKESVVTSQETSVYAESITLLRSKYFQIKAPDGWVYATSLSNDDRFVYVREEQDSQVEQKLEVYVNREKKEKEADFEADYALPITRADDGSITDVGKVSDHCKTSWPEGKNGVPERIQHGGVSFVCHPTSVMYNVIVGDEGGDEVLEFTTQEGSPITFTILYSNYSAYPNANDLYDLMEGFTVL